jgi:hypothetical protein
LIYKVSFYRYKVDIKLKVSAILLYIVKGGKRPLHGLSGGPELHIFISKGLEMERREAADREIR